MIDDIQILHLELMKSLNEKQKYRQKTNGMAKEVALDEVTSFVYLEYNIEDDIERTVNFTSRQLNINDSY